jgi:phage baseplate assembly protein V
MADVTDEGDFDPAELIQIGIIQSVDLAAPSCTVEIDGEESAPMPWLEASMGKLRIWSPPAVGEQVLVITMDGEAGSGVVLRGLPCDAFPAAGNTESYAMIWDDDTSISYDPATKTLTASLPAGSTVAITADDVTITGNVTITGDVAITGNASASGTVTGETDVMGGGISLKDHKHGGVQSGVAQTGAPA